MTKEVIIIALIVLAIYLYYQQNNQANLNIPPNSPEIQDLKAQIQHYQTLYQKRVEKDIEADQSAQIQQLTLANQQLENNFAQATEQSQLLNQKIKDQDTALINLAKRKIKGQKQAETLLNDLEAKWSQKEGEWENHQKTYQSDIQSLQSKLTEQKQQITDLTQDQQQKDRTIIGLNNSYDKLNAQKTQTEAELKKVQEFSKQEKEVHDRLLLAQEQWKNKEASYSEAKKHDKEEITVLQRKNQVLTELVKSGGNEIQSKDDELIKEQAQTKLLNEKLSQEKAINQQLMADWGFKDEQIRNLEFKLENNSTNWKKESERADREHSEKLKRLEEMWKQDLEQANTKFKKRDFEIQQAEKKSAESYWFSKEIMKELNLTETNIRIGEGKNNMIIRKLKARNLLYGSSAKDKKIAKLEQELRNYQKQEQPRKAIAPVKPSARRTEAVVVEETFEKKEEETPAVKSTATQIRTVSKEKEPQPTPVEAPVKKPEIKSEEKRETSKSFAEIFEEFEKTEKKSKK